MSDRPFQYAKSTDPEVIATIQKNHNIRQWARERIIEWVKQFGAEAFYPIRWGTGIAAVALDEKPVGHGKWVWWGKESRPGRPRGVRPADSNPLLAEMTSFGFADDPVPGLADIYKTALPLNDRRGDYMMFWPTPFVALGAAWIGFSMQPTEGDFGPQWVEVKASEWHAAKEAWEEARS